VAELSDYAWLTSDKAGPLLAELAEDSRSELQQLTALRRDHSSVRARLLVEQVDLRRRAVEKFGDRAAQLFFTPVHLEQATDLWIARYKAARLAVAGDRAIDLCCGIGGDLLALAARGPSAGYDTSPLACLFASANAAAENSTVHTTDVTTLPPDPDAAWHLDPDRRPTGRRATNIDAYAPGLEFIDAWRNATARGCVKLAPAAEAPNRWRADAELEWITRDRECRQQVAWLGPTATALGQRRATIVDRNGQAETFVGAVDATCPSENELLEYVMDPDPSILAAGLLPAFAAAHSLQTLGPGGAYLVGGAPLQSRLAATFRIHDRLPLRTTELAKYLRARNIGALEIKKRGVAIDPEALRRQLKLRGNNAATLILTRIGRRETAIVAERVSA
jgi:hypothetical protein